jgi:hypothetical protein
MYSMYRLGHREGGHQVHFGGLSTVLSQRDIGRYHQSYILNLPKLTLTGPVGLSINLQPGTPGRRRITACLVTMIRDLHHNLRGPKRS